MLGRKRHALSGSSMKYGLLTIVSTISINSLQYCHEIYRVSTRISKNKFFAILILVENIQV